MLVHPLADLVGASEGSKSTGLCCKNPNTNFTGLAEAMVHALLNHKTQETDQCADIETQRH